jgi:integrase
MAVTNKDMSGERPTSWSAALDQAASGAMVGEQIKFLLGHASIQTTERYLGSGQEIAVAVNDNLGF